ncbi:hypothetical protein ACOSQ4_011375 [Xanthoceras sorbifolium]
MIPLNHLISIALKWKKMAGIDGGRRTISLPRTSRHRHRPAEKGHFVVYSVDEKRFVVPLSCLHASVFRELFRLSEEEFGLPRDGPIVLPCKAAFLEDVIVCLVDQTPAACNSINVDKALLVSTTTSLVSSTSKCSSSVVAASSSDEDDDQQELVMISSSPITIRQLLMQPFD